MEDEIADREASPEYQQAKRDLERRIAELTGFTAEEPQPEIEESDLFRRGGRFSLDMGFMHQNPEAVQKIMAHVIVVRAESYYLYNAIEYMAVSDLFDVLSMGACCPWYVITLNDAGEVTAARDPNRSDSNG